MVETATTRAQTPSNSYWRKLWSGEWTISDTPDRIFTFGPAPRWIHVLRWAYLACAMLAAFSMVGPIVLIELGGLPLAGAFLIALFGYWRCLRGFFFQPLTLCIGLWACWLLISLLWTPNRDKGVWELGTLRFFYVMLALWPAMTHRRLLIGALAAGFLATNASQVLVALARHFGWKHLDLASAFPGRNPGWWPHPAVCGYLFVAALGLHLPAAVMGTGRVAWIARAATVATWVGIMATGTRGAMLSGTLLTGVVIAVALVVHVRRASPEGRARRLGVLIAGCVSLAAVLGVVAATTTAGARIRNGVHEVTRAARDHDFSTFTGARVQFALWALELWRDHPVRGVGAGGYETTVRRMLDERGEKTKVPHLVPQAHNMFLHAGATLGVVGFVILGGICVTALVGGFRGLTPATIGTYEAGPAFALVGMLLITPFDVPYVNSPPSALLAVLFSMCLLGRPTEVPGFGTSALREWLSRR